MKLESRPPAEEVGGRWAKDRCMPLEHKDYLVVLVSLFMIRFCSKRIFQERCFVLIVFGFTLSWSVIDLQDLSHQALKELINLEMQNVTWILFLRLRYVNEVLFKIEIVGWLVSIRCISSILFLFLLDYQYDWQTHLLIVSESRLCTIILSDGLAEAPANSTCARWRYTHTHIIVRDVCFQAQSCSEIIGSIILWSYTSKVQQLAPDKLAFPKEIQ